ncbi:MAG: PEP-CTERM sorting domain-containing protein [Deltaproteobacteria bacterium]|nr:PEP-CTERM sorting domain-containing protein [Deltaproteobacteria bacterium]
MIKSIVASVLLFIYIFGFIIISTVFADGNGAPDSISVPEPASLLLLGVGLVSLAGFGRKKLKK